MKPKGLPLTGWKKVAEDDKSATMQHHSGHKMTIAKGSLSKAHQKLLADCPLHAADGTVIADNDPSGAFAGNAAADSAANAPMPEQDVSQPVPGGLVQSAGPQGAPVPQEAPKDPNDDPAAGIGGYDMAKKGLQNEYNAMSGEGAQQSNIWAKALQQQQQDDIAYRDALRARSNEIDAHVKDTEAGHINPNHYAESQSGLGKISSAIGILLGGIGAGLQHSTHNAAMDNINRQIDRDIDAQKANLNHKDTVLGAYMKQYGNEADAINMARAARAAQVAAQIQQSAAQAKSQYAKGAGQLAVSQLQQQYFPLVQQAAANEVAQRTGRNPTLPDQYDPNLAQSFRVNGVKYYAQDGQTAEKARASSQAIDALEQSAKNINEFNQKHGMVLNPFSEEAGSAESLNSTSKAAIASLEAQGGSIARLADTFRDAMPTAGAINQGKARGKVAGIDQIVHQAKHALVSTHALQGPTMMALPGAKK